VLGNDTLPSYFVRRLSSVIHLKTTQVVFAGELVIIHTVASTVSHTVTVQPFKGVAPDIAHDELHLCTSLSCNSVTLSTLA